MHCPCIGKIRDKWIIFVNIVCFIAMFLLLLSSAISGQSYPIQFIILKISQWTKSICRYTKTDHLLWFSAVNFALNYLLFRFFFRSLFLHLHVQSFHAVEFYIRYFHHIYESIICVDGVSFHNSKKKRRIISSKLFTFFLCKPTRIIQLNICFCSWLPCVCVGA